MRVPDSDGALGEMADQIPLPGHVDIQVRVLQMEGQTVQSLQQAQEKGGRRRPVPGIPRQIP